MVGVTNQFGCFLLPPLVIYSTRPYLSDLFRDYKYIHKIIFNSTRRALQNNVIKITYENMVKVNIVAYITTLANTVAYITTLS